MCILKSRCGCHTEKGLEERKRVCGDQLGNLGPSHAELKELRRERRVAGCVGMNHSSQSQAHNKTTDLNFLQIIVNLTLTGPSLHHFADGKVNLRHEFGISCHPLTLQSYENILGSHVASRLQSSQWLPLSHTALSPCEVPSCLDTLWLLCVTL